MGSREKVVGFLAVSGVPYELRDFDESTKNSALAALALGCTVAEIAKSVVFAGERTGVVILSGDKRVNTLKVAHLLGGEARIATPEEVRERTGYPIGGVPPFPHLAGVRVMADSSLNRFSHVWAAAGTPNSVFKIGTADLLRLLGAGPFDLAE